MKHCSTSRFSSVFDLHLSAGRDPRIRYNRAEERHPDPPASGTGLSYAKEIAVRVRHSTHLGPVFPSVCESLSGRLTPTIGPVGQNEGPTKARLCFLGKQPKPVIARPHVQAFRSLYWCKPSEGSALRQPHPPLTVGSEGHRAGALPAPGVEAYLVDRSETVGAARPGASVPTGLAGRTELVLPQHGGGVAVCRLVVPLEHIRIEVNPVRPTDRARNFVNPDFGEDLRVPELFENAAGEGRSEIQLSDEPIRKGQPESQVAEREGLHDSSELAHMATAYRRGSIGRRASGICARASRQGVPHVGALPTPLPSGRQSWKIASDDHSIADADLSLMRAIYRVEVRRVVVTPVHVDHDAVELRQPGHREEAMARVSHRRCSGGFSLVIDLLETARADVLIGLWRAGRFGLMSYRPT